MTTIEYSLRAISPILLLTVPAIIYYFYFKKKEKFNNERNLRRDFSKALEKSNEQLVDLQVFVHALGFDPDEVVKFMSDCNDPMLRDFCLNHLTITINDEQLQKELPNGYMKQISEWFSEQTKSKVHDRSLYNEQKK